jgi:2-amino-4-hydroxy-6-hydroxymethyldihydropteridine diphosphokinase
VVDPARHAAEGSPSWFINGVAELKTALSPIEIFRACLRIEQQMGRKRSQAAPAPLSRSIDLDLLLHGDVVMKSEELTLPHPRFHLRRFVLAPLAEVAPTLIHPTLELTIAELLGRLSASDGEMHRVLKVAPAPQPH